MMFHKILVGYDGSDGAKHALKVAINLAKQYDAELHSISVEEHVPRYAATIGEVDEFKKEANGFFKEINDEAIEEAKSRDHSTLCKRWEIRPFGNRLYGSFKDIRQGMGFDLTKYYETCPLYCDCSKVMLAHRRWGSPLTVLKRLITPTR
jgi:hypothetical protein